MLKVYSLQSMVWFLKLLIFTEVVMEMQQVHVDAGFVTWKVVENTIVFGKDVVILCTYHNSLSCTDHIFWTWTIGMENDIIMTDGILSETYKNKQKYSEIISPCTRYSKLAISNFTESDYREIYKCGIAYINNTENSFVEYSKGEISFRKTAYAYVPADKMVSTELNLTNHQISFRLRIAKIYPLPECHAQFADISVTNALKVQKKKIGLFYYVAFTYTTSNMSLVTFRDLCIWCNGNGSQWKSLHPFCSKKSDLTTERDLFDMSPIEGYYLAALVFVGVFYTLYPISSMVVLIRLYFASKDLMFTTKQILKRIDNISKVCSGSCVMFGVLSYGVRQVKVQPGFQIPTDNWMNIFHIVAILSPVICSIPLCVVTISAEWKLPRKKLCATYLCCICQILQLVLGVYINSGMLHMTTTALNNTYASVFIFWMPTTGMTLLLFFWLSKILCIKSIEKLHHMRGERLLLDEEISGNVDNSPNNKEIRELLPLNDSNRQSDQEMDTEVKFV